MWCCLTCADNAPYFLTCHGVTLWYCMHYKNDNAMDSADSLAAFLVWVRIMATGCQRVIKYMSSSFKIDTMFLFVSCLLFFIPCPLFIACNFSSILCPLLVKSFFFAFFRIRHKRFPLVKCNYSLVVTMPSVKWLAKRGYAEDFCMEEPTSNGRAKAGLYPIIRPAEAGAGCYRCPAYKLPHYSVKDHHCARWLEGETLQKR